MDTWSQVGNYMRVDGCINNLLYMVQEYPQRVSEVFCGDDRMRGAVKGRESQRCYRADILEGSM